MECEKIWYRLEHIRDAIDAIMVQSAVPGERWDIEFFGDGRVEVERVRSDGLIGGDRMLETLFREFSD